jgi:hypothetical protein
MHRMLEMAFATITLLGAACAQTPASGSSEKTTLDARQASFMVLPRTPLLEDSETRLSNEVIRAELLPRVRLLKVAADYFYNLHASYPQSEAQLGLPQFPPSPAIASTQLIGANFEINLSPSAGGGQIVLTHRAELGYFPSYWTCRSTNVSDVAAILPGCLDAAPAVPTARRDAAWQWAFRGELRDELMPIGRFYSLNIMNYFSATGVWPTAAQLGANTRPMRWVQSVEILPAPNRGFQIRLNAEAGGDVLHFAYVPDLLNAGYPDGYFVCTSARADISAIFPGCDAQLANAELVDVFADPYWTFAKYQQIRDEYEYAQSALANLAEFYAVNGRWPDTLAQGGVLRFGARRWFRGDGYQPGEYRLYMSDEAGGGTLVFHLIEGSQAAPVWRCTSEREDIASIIPSCRSQSTPDVDPRPNPNDADGFMAHRVMMANDLMYFGNAIRINIAEFFAARGVMPTLSDLALMGFPEDFAPVRLAVERVQLETAGVINFALTRAAGGGSVRFQPVIGSGEITSWQCQSRNRVDIGNLIPLCTFAP